ncbi:synapse-associated protein of 47 kDa-like [Teleopsis dalmanni]|uniref:synapse-associated protein of 47 kDa-like n=1 Tax=Teleopsis dalmanni TaxID=139649 RepID=UPI0018CE0EB3|nr:synapse-associated protein of 47 kDa-like [Teleopsis dalmanni]XP_037950372.1 synapse-associated protein of 47 kDa-like [Teleopsis dalmanni]XP_037950373.1 synapse-associated protein of 47 kDa-like [Teleopsis dalmanni]XP_037950374.1 synapse-associated protein of 47 kDa-like [Teleopsis dalmanni]XP_037950375.1 synapse-associated protein of 47 kDa-like [Teleopsis dalmanni]XP_037950376.1 synapse-associated protein of 47 kDa-like [Teleopsis dalmanni]
MFSGLTNQFTSLVGAVKGGQTDEDASAPTQDASAADATVTAGGATLEQDANAAAGGEHAEGEEGAKR